MSSKRIQTVILTPVVVGGVANVNIDLNFEPKYFKIISCCLQDNVGLELNYIRCPQLNSSVLCFLTSNLPANLAFNYLDIKHMFEGNYQNHNYSFQVFDIIDSLSASTVGMYMTIQFFE